MLAPGHTRFGAVAVAVALAAPVSAFALSTTSTPELYTSNDSTDARDRMAGERLLHRTPSLAPSPPPAKLASESRKWVSPDPLFLNDPAQIVGKPLEGTNLYGYVSNNPVNGTDPTGLADDWTRPGAWVGAPDKAPQPAFAPEQDAAFGRGLVAGASYVPGPIGVVGNGIAVADRAAHGDVTGAAAHVAGMAASAIAGKVLAKAVGAIGGLVKKLLGRGDALPAPEAGQKLYRVYGGDAKPEGASWTLTDPRTVPNFRDAAGLPSGGASGATNSGRFVIEGTLQNPMGVVKTRTAMPLDGTKGGAPEFIIPNPISSGAVRVDRVSGVNPEF